MAFPAGWPPRTASGQKSLRVYLTGTATADFDANAFLFSRVDIPIADMVFANASAAIGNPDTFTFTTGAPDDTVTRATGSFVTDGFKIGGWMTVESATTPANNGRYLITGVAALTLTFADATFDTYEADASAQIAVDNGLTADITSAGSNLPLLDVGAQFEVRDHATNNGTYVVTAVTTPTDDITVLALDVTPVNAASEAALIRDTNGNPYIPLPVVNPGASTPVVLDSNPMGGGENDLGAAAPMIFSNTVLVTAAAAAVEISFDGINVHGAVPSGETRIYSGRNEAGIAVRGVGATFTVEAW